MGIHVNKKLEIIFGHSKISTNAIFDINDMQKYG